MARKTETVKVDETYYRIEQLSTTPGLKLYNQLAHVLGDAIREELKTGGSAEELMPRIMLRALTVIPEDMQIQLGVTFAACCQVKHGDMWLELNEDVYEQHFAGQLSHWTMWVLACLRVNFSDFLSRAKRFTPTPVTGPAETTTASA